MATMSTDPNAQATEPGPDGPATEESPTTESIRKLRAERDQYFDQLRRSQAEFANYQKRAKAQADLDREYYVAALAKDILDVLDNLERSIDAARSSGAAGIVEGVEMVHKQLLGALAKHGVEVISPLGEHFDPNFHEAVMRRPASPEHPADTVTNVLGKGYKLKDRVLRPAKVAVATDH
jgi:molecular chaperone GrpE